MQGGRRGDRIEMAGQVGQGLDLAGDMQPGAELLGQFGDPVRVPVQAEHLVTLALQHQGEAPVAGAEVEHPPPPAVDQPGGRSLRIGRSTPTAHAANSRRGFPV